MAFLKSHMNYQGLDASQDQGEICKHYRICRTRMRSVIATRVRQIEQLRISGYLNMRTFLSSFDRKSLCSVTAGITMGLGKLFVSRPAQGNRRKILARTGR